MKFGIYEKAVAILFSVTLIISLAACTANAKRAETAYADSGIAMEIDNTGSIDLVE